MLAKVCFWKMFSGETLKNKKGTQNATTLLHIFYIQSNKCFKINLSAKEIFIKPTNIDPLKNSRIWNLKQPSYW